MDKWLSNSVSVMSNFPQSKLYLVLFEKFMPKGAEILQNFHGSKWIDVSRGVNCFT